MNTRRIVIIPALVLAVSISAAEKAGYVDGGSAFGGSYVVTDYTPTSKAIIEAEVSWDSSSMGGAIFGASAAGGANINSFVLWGYAGGALNFYYSDWGTAQIPNALREKCKVRCTPDGMWLDDEKVITKTPKDFTCGSKLVVFARGEKTENKGYCTVYSLKAWEPDEGGEYQLVLSLRPCRCTDDLIQFYDEKSGKVFTNGATGFPIAPTIIVPSTDGIGDAAALVDAFSCVKKAGANKAASYYQNADIRIEPGIYRLGERTVSDKGQLDLGACGGAHVTGLGKTPGDTVIVGGGASVGLGVLYVEGGAAQNRMVISNLTLTGGYATSRFGGGASGTTGKENIDWCNLVLTNNVALNGGGCAYGIAYNCHFENNRALKGGGGAYLMSVFDSTFVGNGCGLTQKWSGGGAINGVTATRCVFTGNVDNETPTGDMWMYGATARDSTLTDCIITNSVGLHDIVCACTLNRCRISGCGKSVSSAQDFCVLGNYNTDAVVHDVVNCVIDDITALDAVDHVVRYGNLVNCTIRGFKGAAGGSTFDATSKAVNTIISQCTPFDITVGSSPVLSYCLWSSQSGSFDELPPGCKVGSAKFAGNDSDIRANSGAFNAALESDEVLALVGVTDCDGRPRTMFGHLDMGAMECQSESLPGLILLLK